MIKDTLRHILVFLLPLAVAACGSDADEQQSDSTMQSAEPISFSAGLAADASVTRASVTTENAWPANTRIAIHEDATSKTLPYVTAANGGNAEAIPLRPEGNTLSDMFYWAVTKESRTFRAWYPYSSSPWTLPKAVSVPADQNAQSADAYYAQDILYAPSTTFEYKQRGAQLDFYHQLCRVVVNVTSTGTQNLVDEVKMGTDNIALSGNITTLGSSGLGATGTTTAWSGVTGSATVNMRNNAALRNDARYFAVYECMLPPQSGGDFDTPLFTIKATKDTTTKTYKYRDSFDFQAGYQYTYNLLLSKGGVVIIATVSVGNWGAVSFASGSADVPDDTH